MRYSSDSSPKVNAGSMADIAFLLLIFFLVSTTISTDEGINRKLPRKCPTGNDCSIVLNERNVLRIVLNKNQEIMVEKEIIPIRELKNLIKNFVDNNADNSCDYCNGNKNINSSDNPIEAVISLQNDRKTSYELYMNVQDEITKAYYELRVDYSKLKFDKLIDDLSKKEIKILRDVYPFKISEAETL